MPVLDSELAMYLVGQSSGVRHLLRDRINATATIEHGTWAIAIITMRAKRVMRTGLPRHFLSSLGTVRTMQVLRVVLTGVRFQAGRLLQPGLVIAVVVLPGFTACSMRLMWQKKHGSWRKQPHRNHHKRDEWWFTLKWAASGDHL